MTLKYILTGSIDESLSVGEMSVDTEAADVEIPVSTVEMGVTRKKIPTDLQTSPLIGNFLLYNFCSAL